MVTFDLGKLEPIRQMAHWFAENQLRPVSLECDRTKEIPQELVETALAMGISQGAGSSPAGAEGIGGEHRDGGGHKTTNRLAVVGAEEMAWGDPALVTAFPGPGLGAPPVRFTGTPEQRERFFSIFDDGTPKWAAYACTEPGAGSDVAAIRTSAVKDGDHYLLNGRKIFVTNGARASWVVVFATVDPALGRGGHRAFVVEQGTPGLEVGRIEDKMGLRASETAELVLTDCRVPAENLLGGEDHYRKVGSGGFKTAMKTFDNTRPLVAAMAVGIARAAFEKTQEFCQDAYMLNRPIPRYASLRDTLLTMERRIEAARLLCWRAAWMADAGIPNSKEASMSKAHAAEVGQWVTSKAVEMMGGFGWEHERLVEKLYRDVKVFDIFEGTGQVQRLIISRKLMPEIRIR